jgi:hypothetical protein
MTLQEEKVPCPECGVLILPATATKTGGLCMPCKNGIRQNIEESKAFYEKQRIHMESPERKHWEWLVDRVYKTEGGFDALTPSNRLYFAVNLLSGDVFNGGFDQYFHNSAGDYYAEAVEGLQAMGATRTLELLFAAKRAIFGDLEVPSDRMRRYEAMQACGEAAWEVISTQLDAIDRRFYDADHDRDLAERIDRYAEAHALREGF